MIYIVSKKGIPLMPTTRYGHVRKLLKQNKAVVINNNPFTVRLKYETSNITQPLTIGIDSGRENIGLSVSDEKGTNLFNVNIITNNKQIKYSLNLMTLEIILVFFIKNQFSIPCFCRGYNEFKITNQILIS